MYQKNEKLKRDIKMRSHSFTHLPKVTLTKNYQITNNLNNSVN